jgi:hypothetical protein
MDVEPTFLSLMSQAHTAPLYYGRTQFNPAADLSLIHTLKPSTTALALAGARILAIAALLLLLLLLLLHHQQHRRQPAARSLQPLDQQQQQQQQLLLLLPFGWCLVHQGGS